MTALKLFGRAPFAALGAVLLAAGCAQVPPDAGQNPADPFEKFNRNMWAFNDAIDRAVLKPVATAYVDWVPEIVRNRVTNMTDNLFEPSNALNNTLQGKVDDGITSVFRFLINSTFGIVGMFDVAEKIGMQRHEEDFGQTLGVWGVPSGPYLVLPFMGPSSVRDVTRYAEEFGTSPLTYAFWDEDWWIGASFTVVAVIDGRAQLLQLENIRESTIDEYVAVRDAYLKMRANLVRDGEALDEEEELEQLTPLEFDE